MDEIFETEDLLSKLAMELPQLIAGFHTVRHDLNKRMRTLEEQGLIYATQHYRSSKYLYLLYPMQPGEPRRRKYVGIDPEKIEAANAAILRAKEYDKLKKKLTELDFVHSLGCAKLHEAVVMLSRIKSR